MIHTITISPTGILKDYIAYLAFREFDSYQEVLLKPMPAKHEIHMMLMINSKMHGFQNSKNHKIQQNVEADCNFSGLLTTIKGSIVFKGHVTLLTIHFKPTGFYRLFGIAPSKINDCLGDARDLFSNHITTLHEQLHDAKTTQEMFWLTEQFLIEKLRSQKANYDCCSILKVSNFLVNQPRIHSIKQLAHHTNMSLKTFERKFTEQVGLSPKLFYRIKRFNEALDMKLNQPQLSWTNICHQFGYYDQTHLVKDFYAFTDEAPSTFFKNTPPPIEQISSIYESEG